MGAAIVSGLALYQKGLRSQYTEDAMATFYFEVCRKKKGVGDYDYDRGIFTCKINPLALSEVPGEIIFRYKYRTNKLVMAEKWQHGRGD